MAAVACLTAGFAVPAGASWGASHTGAAWGRATSLPPAPAPSASVSGDTVELSWPPASLADGTAPSGYRVTRYAADGTASGTAGSCAHGSGSLSCSDSPVPPGTWTYRLQVGLAGWLGPTGPASEPVVVADPGAGLDVTAPTISALVVAKAEGGAAGFVRKGGGYHVYAAAADGGSGATGVSTVHADVRAVTPGTTAAPLSPGMFVVDGKAYGYRSALLQAATTLVDGVRDVSVTAADLAGNRSTSSATVVVDSTPPMAIDVQAVNGGVAGRPDGADRLIFTYSEPVDAPSIITGWDGSTTTVAVRVVRTGGSSVFDVWNLDSTPVRIGTVTSAQRYTAGSVIFHPSQLVRTGNTLVLTLGPPDGSTTAGSADTLRWTPAAGAVDRAGNALPTTARNETGPVDIDF